MSDLTDGMTVETTEVLDSLPIGTVARDKDGLFIVRLSENEWLLCEGRIHEPSYWGHDEVRGDYVDPSVDDQPFLPLTEIRLPY